MIANALSVYKMTNKPTREELSGITSYHLGDTMTDKPMTVGDIRNFIKDLPDEMPVLVHHNIPHTNDCSEMLPLGDLYVEEQEEKTGKVLEIYPKFPRYW
jgi:hypothetical protein